MGSIEPSRTKKAEPSDPPKSPVDREFGSWIFGSDWVIANVLAYAATGSHVAVGTAISGRPPHRSVRAELLHTAPTFDVDVRSVLQDTDGGYVGWGAIDCRSS